MYTAILCIHWTEMYLQNCGEEVPVNCIMWQGIFTSDYAYSFSSSNYAMEM